MPQVSGVSGTLPGHRLSITDGTCEDCGAPATCCMQGGTDSMGAEWWTLCNGCAEKRSSCSPVGECARCKQDSEKLVPTRDFEEGLSGPVYWVCTSCRAADEEAEAAEVAELEQEERERELRPEAPWRPCEEWPHEDDEENPEEDYPPASWCLGDVHARVLWPRYGRAGRLVPTLEVRLTRPLGELPVGTRL